MVKIKTMSLILDNLSKHISLTPQEQELFLSKTEIRQYKAKTVLLNAGEICKNSYFVNSGVLRSFNINDNIVEHVLSFACSGWWISDMYSLAFAKTRQSFHSSFERCGNSYFIQRKSRNTVSGNPQTRTLFQDFNRKFIGGTPRTIDGQFEFNRRGTLRKVLHQTPRLNPESSPKTNCLLFGRNSRIF